jgi:hypothetical protein
MEDLTGFRRRLQVIITLDSIDVHLKKSFMKTCQVLSERSLRNTKYGIRNTQHVLRIAERYHLILMG